ncbi:MAG: SPOR domain-containing protein [Rickettsiales bacterium]
MRPDMEDYAEIDEPKANNSRAMSWMVLAVAVGGFAALAYYAYNSGGDKPTDSEMMVQADPAPIKETPANPEGEQFANKDKTIYDVIANADTQTAEKMLPDAEHPSAAATNLEDSEDSAPAPVASTTSAPAAPSTTTFVAEAPTNVTEQPVATTPAPATETKPVEKSFSSPQIINEKKVAVKKPTVEKPKAAAKPAATGGSYMLQLGAFKSEEEAQSAWKKISGAHSAVVGSTPTIVKAEVNGSTFYRLRTGSFGSSAAAKEACGKLGGAACFPVK